MATPLAFLNGRFLPFREAALPVHDAGFVSGATVVDTARTFRRSLFRWPEHLARFRGDCQVCYVPLEASDEYLTVTAEELITHNEKLLPPGGELVLVTFATPGPLGYYLGEPTLGPATLGMVTYPLPVARYRPYFTEGITLVGVAGQVTRSKSVLPATVKHRSRMLWHVVDHTARAIANTGATLGILLGPGERLLETSVANFLAVIEGVVITPERKQILDGISLRVTQELCEKLGLPFVEAPVLPADLRRASEALLTGTAFGLAGVRQVIHPSLDQPQQFEWPGPVFRQLLAAWNELVGVNLEEQFTAVE
jgi:branched-chain amino acid aminotransferase